MSEPVRFALLYSPDLPPTSCRTTYLHVSHLFPIRPAPLLVYLLPSWARPSVFNHPTFPAVCVIGPFRTWIVWATELIVPGDLNWFVGWTNIRKEWFWVLCNWLWYQINSDILPWKVWHFFKFPVIIKSCLQHLNNRPFRKTIKNPKFIFFFHKCELGCQTKTKKQTRRELNYFLSKVLGAFRPK